MAITDLSAQLWHERELLDVLTFKLEEEQLLLTAGKSRWISHATREVEHVLDWLAAAGLARTVTASAVALQWGLPEDSTLAQLAAGAPDGPWREILEAHLTALTQQTGTIRALRDANAQFLRAAGISAQESLAQHTPAAPTSYDARGRATADSGPRLFDRAI